MQADTAVRSAANVLTFGTTDETEAALEATLGLDPQQTWRGRYEDAIQAQEQRNAYDREHRRLAMLVGDAAGLGLGFGVGAGPAGGRVAQAVARLPRDGKRYVGEGMSVLRTLGKGDLPISFQKAITVPGGVSRTDHQTLRGFTAEAKYRASGRRGKLTPRQQEAKEMLGDKYREDWWGPRDVRRFTGKSVLGGMAAGRAEQDR